MAFKHLFINAWSKDSSNLLILTLEVYFYHILFSTKILFVTFATFMFTLFTVITPRSIVFTLRLFTLKQIFYPDHIS